MCMQDDFIRFEWGQKMAQRLQQAGLAVTFLSVPDTHHSMADIEIQKLTEWLTKQLG